MEPSDLHNQHNHRKVGTLTASSSLEALKAVILAVCNMIKNNKIGVLAFPFQ